MSSGRNFEKAAKHCQKVVSVVLGSYNRFEYLKFAIDSIREEVKDIDHEIIVIEGGSTDGSLEWLIRQKDIITIVQHNRGEWNGRPITRKSWGYFMNLGFKCAKGKYICMVSDDCIVLPNAIKNGIKLFEASLDSGEKVGAMAFYWKDWPTNYKYEIRMTLENNLYVNQGMYLKQALEEVGYIDEDTYMFYFADCDLCLKMLQKGYKCIESPDSYILHYAHANKEVRGSNSVFFQEEFENFKDRWEGIYYNRELDNYVDKILYKSFDDSTLIESLTDNHYPIEHEENKKIIEINELIRSRCKNRRVVVYGAGEHTERLFDNTEIVNMDILYCVDKNLAGEHIRGYGIFKPEKLIENKPEVVVVSSLKFQNEIFQYLREKIKYDGDIVLLYKDNEYKPYYSV